MKKNIPIFFILICCLQLSAQKAPHELSIFGGGGFAAFGFQPSKNISSAGYCADVGIGFTGFVSQQIGFHIGAGFGLYNVKSKMNELLSFATKDLKDINGYDYELYTTLSDYVEIQKPFFINVPFMLQFQTKQGRMDKAGFYAMAGVKALFLIKNQYEASVGELNNRAYYPDFNNWADTQLFAGYGKYDGTDTTGLRSLDVIVMVAVEAGVKWRIGKSLFLYTGAFFDCALNDPLKNSRTPYSDYITEDSFSDFSLLKIANKANVMMAGIKLRLAFTTKRKSNIYDCPYKR